MSRKGKIDITSSIAISIILSIVAFVVVFIILNNGKSNEVTITGGGSIVGLRCENNTLIHPVFSDYTPKAFTNEITANFQNDNLTSIMYQYEGEYNSAEEAGNAEASASADYNIILSKKYGEKTNIFSHEFAKDGEKLSLTITGDANKVSSKTATYFLLDSTETFPRQIDVMKEAYENNEFSCKIIE